MPDPYTQTLMRCVQMEATVLQAVLRLQPTLFSCTCRTSARCLCSRSSTLWLLALLVAIGSSLLHEMLCQR